MIQSFAPLPELTARQEMALLLRVLCTEGYDDHNAGHVTLDLGDGTVLVNPYQLTWADVRASDLQLIDHQGRHVGGDGGVAPAILIHTKLRQARPDARVIVHNHPEWATVWADRRQVPPIYDQTSAQISHSLYVVDEYGGSFNQDEVCDLTVKRFGDAQWALLANHGAIIVADTIADAYLRASTLEWRSRKAWQVEALGPGAEPLPEELAVARGREFEAVAARAWWEGAARRYLRQDPSVLD